MKHLQNTKQTSTSITIWRKNINILKRTTTSPNVALQFPSVLTTNPRSWVSLATPPHHLKPMQFMIQGQWWSIFLKAAKGARWLHTMVVLQLQTNILQTDIGSTPAWAWHKIFSKASNVGQVPQTLTRLWKINPGLVCWWDSSLQVWTSDKGGDAGDMFFDVGLGTSQWTSTSNHICMYIHIESNKIQTKMKWDRQWDHFISTLAAYNWYFRKDLQYVALFSGKGASIQATSLKFLLVQTCSNHLLVFSQTAS